MTPTLLALSLADHHPAHRFPTTEEENQHFERRPLEPAHDPHPLMDKPPGGPPLLNGTLA
jgi:hypothetical protein